MRPQWQSWLEPNVVACDELVQTLGDRFPGVARALCNLCKAALSSLPPQVDALLRIAQTERHWAKMHDAFDEVRRVTIATGATEEGRGSAEFYMLAVAEDLAKVLYNATRPRDPFDPDSPRRLLVSVAHFSKRARSAQLERSLCAEMELAVGEKP